PPRHQRPLRRFPIRGCRGSVNECDGDQGKQRNTTHGIGSGRCNFTAFTLAAICPRGKSPPARYSRRLPRLLSLPAAAKNRPIGERHMWTKFSATFLAVFLIAMLSGPVALADDEVHEGKVLSVTSSS